MEMGNSIRNLLEEGLKTDDPEITHALKKIMKAMADK